MRPNQDNPAAHRWAPRIIYSGPRNTIVNILLSNLLYALAVTRMESAEEGPGVNIDKLGMQRDNLTGRLEALGPGEAVRGPGLDVRATFATLYKDRQLGLLRMALEELNELARRGPEKDTEGVDGSGVAGAAFVDIVCLSCFVFDIVFLS